MKGVTWQKKFTQFARFWTVCWLWKWNSFRWQKSMKKNIVTRAHFLYQY